MGEEEQGLEDIPLYNAEKVDIPPGKVSESTDTTQDGRGNIG